MQTPFKALAVLASSIFALCLTQYVNAGLINPSGGHIVEAPVERSAATVQVVKEVVKVDGFMDESLAADNIEVKICSEFYLGPPCTSVVLVPGSCAMVPFNLLFSSMSYNGPLVSCRLYSGPMCGGKGTPAGDTITLPYDVTADLSRVGWNKKANSFDCHVTNQPVRALSFRDITPRTVALAHHGDLDLMHITIYDKILFEDDDTPGSGYEFVTESDLCIKLRDVEFERKTSSIKFERGPVCTFFENGDCNGGPKLVLATQETNLKAFHTDDWKTWNDRISSFFCQWKSDLKSRHPAANEINVAQTPAGGEIKVTLWTDKLFGGEGDRWSLQPGACAWLMSTKKENVISSVDFERGQTCTFYETPNCNNIIGKEHAPTLVLNFGQTNLAAFHTDDWKSWNDRIGSFSCVWSH